MVAIATGFFASLKVQLVGVSAAAGYDALSAALILGFAVHNADGRPQYG